MQTLPGRMLYHLFGVSLISYLCLGLVSIVFAQGAWPPARVNGDPNNPNRFSSNGKWYTITYVSTANNGTPQSPTTAYVDLSYSYGTDLTAILNVTVNKAVITLSRAQTSVHLPIDRPGQPNNRSTDANNGTGGLDRYLEYQTSAVGAVANGGPAYAFLDGNSSPAPWITYKIVCSDPTASFGITVRIAHGAYAQAFGGFPPFGSWGSVQSSASADNKSANVMVSSGVGMTSDGSTTLVNTGNSTSYTCTLSGGVGYIAVPLTSPLTSISVTTSGGRPPEGGANARHDIMPIEVIGP
ncbi:MAG TPA: hypothetical protein VFB21_05715 [Chthonomonadaceae bacterium]|nr:hypothetical protein [Chthonomonadaceae bacterium]